jgi:thiamine biosynthesis protein ThiS
MRIMVNGEGKDVAEGTSVRQLIESLTPKGAACAAEVNQQLVPRREQESRVLTEGDRVEIVTLVGGG